MFGYLKCQRCLVGPGAGLLELRPGAWFWVCLRCFAGLRKRI